MGTKQIRVSESYHAYLKSKQREGETLGETAERLGRDFSLYEWAEELDEIDDSVLEEHAETLREIDDEDDFAELDDELPT